MVAGGLLLITVALDCRVGATDDEAEDRLSEARSFAAKAFAVSASCRQRLASASASAAEVILVSSKFSAAMRKAAFSVRRRVFSASSVSVTPLRCRSESEW